MTNAFSRLHAAVSTDVAVENYQAVRGLLSPSCRVMAVVKANAYGHGAVPMAQALAAAGVEWFAVSSLEEAAELREAGITQPILILAYTPPAAAAVLARLQVTQAVADAAYAAALNEAAAAAAVQVTVHIKLDTGMSRIGFVYHDENADAAALSEIAAACRLPQLHAEGVFTHFATADEAEDTQTPRQFALFTAAIRQLEKQGITFSLHHCCNSAATLRYPHMHLDMVRPGIVLYGYAPDAGMPLPVTLTPAMTLRTVVAQVKTLPAGARVSYGGTAVTERDTVLATVPIGYADGLPRACGNRCCLTVNGTRVPIVGRVCMDQCVLDVTGVPVQVGDTVTVFGDGAAMNELAAAADTIAYEILCRVGRRVPREY